MGCIYKKSDTKNYMFKVVIDGHKVVKSLKTNDIMTAKKRAKELENEIIRLRYNGHKPNFQKDISFNELSERFLITQHEWKPRTRDTYERVIYAYISGKMPGNDQTQRLYNRHLSVIYNWGVKNGYVKENPFKEKPKKSVPKIDYYSMREVKNIFENLPKSKVGDIIRFAFYTGCRLGELAHLTKEDVLEDKIILNGKTGRRTIPITDKIRGIISDRMFDFNENSLRLALHKKGISATKIRHTFATTLVKNGMSIYMVAKLLGHKSVKTTEIYYAHLMPEEIKNHTKWLKY